MSFVCACVCVCVLIVYDTCISDVDIRIKKKIQLAVHSPEGLPPCRNALCFVFCLLPRSVGLYTCHSVSSILKILAVSMATSTNTGSMFTSSARTVRPVPSIEHVSSVTVSVSLAQLKCTWTDVAVDVLFSASSLSELGRRAGLTDLLLVN